MKQQSCMETWCRRDLISPRCIISYLHVCKQNLVGDKNNSKIPCASVKNFQLTLVWAKEYFPVSSKFLGPVEPQISIFQRNGQQMFILHSWEPALLIGQAVITVSDKMAAKNISRILQTGMCSKNTQLTDNVTPIATTRSLCMRAFTS